MPNTFALVFCQFRGLFELGIRCYNWSYQRMCDEFQFWVRNGVYGILTTGISCQQWIPIWHRWAPAKRRNQPHIETAERAWEKMLEKCELYIYLTWFVHHFRQMIIILTKGDQTQIHNFAPACVQILGNFLKEFCDARFRKKWIDLLLSWFGHASIEEITAMET